MPFFVPSGDGCYDQFDSKLFEKDGGIWPCGNVATFTARFCFGAVVVVRGGVFFQTIVVMEPFRKNVENIYFLRRERKMDNSYL